MGAARILILTVALVAAIGLAIIVRNMMVGGQAPAPVAEAKAPETPMARVLVAKRDLPIGTRLAPADLGWQPWPADNLNATFITDGQAPAAPASTATEKAMEKAGEVMSNLNGSGAVDSLVGAIVREAIVSGEPIQARKLVRGGEGGYLAVVLEPGKRALGVPVTQESGAGGFILPGDRVDVIQSREVEQDGQQVRVTQPVVLNVRVLAIDQATKPADDANAIVGAVATLEVSPDAALALTEAEAEGDLQLALRSYADINGYSGPAGPVSPGAGAKPTVKIFSQGETTEVAVTQ